MRCVVLAKADYQTHVVGLPVVVETRRGRVRRGKEPDGTPWSTLMEVPYGYFPGVKGLDGGDLDVYVGPDRDAPDVYLVTTMQWPDYTAPDEIKVFAQFASASAVHACFHRHYDNPRALGRLRRLSVAQFRCIMQECREAGATIAP
jgi:Inorganic Pyrophosphatase